LWIGTWLGSIILAKIAAGALKKREKEGEKDYAARSAVYKTRAKRESRRCKMFF
jgi:hypothetical protein